MLCKYMRSAALYALLSLPSIRTSTEAISAEDIERILTHRQRFLEEIDDEPETTHIKKIVRSVAGEEEQEENIVELNMRKEYNETLPDLELAKEAEIQLARLDCQPSSCNGDGERCTHCAATMCMTKALHMPFHPEKYPNWMYVTDTTHCRVQSKTFGFNALYDEIAAFDAPETAPTVKLPVKMIILETGFTSSDRLTRGLTADPSNLVLVDPQPINEALMQCHDKRKEILRKEGEGCNVAHVIDLVQRVTDVMCRARKEDGFESCIIKLWADAAVAIDIVEDAFSAEDGVSIEYVYANADQYLGGTMFDENRPIRAPCAKHKTNPSKLMIEEAAKQGTTPQKMEIEELCAMEMRISMNTVMGRKKISNRVNMIHADELEARLDEVADRVYKTEGVGIPSFLRVKFLDVLDKDTHGNKDPNRYAKEKAARSNKVKAKGKNAITNLVQSVELEIKDADNKDKCNKNKGRGSGWGQGQNCEKYDVTTL